MWTIRAAHPTDWPAIRNIHERACIDELRHANITVSHQYLPDISAFRDCYRNSIWIADLETRIVAFVARKRDDISWLYVDPNHYRIGIGRALLRFAIGQCGGAVRASMLADNLPALRLYLSEGFKLAEAQELYLAGASAPIREQILRRSPITPKAESAVVLSGAGSISG